MRCAPALDRLRDADPSGRVNLAELVILGADRKVKQLERERADDVERAGLRERFHDVIADRTPLAFRSLWIAPRGAVD